MFQHTAARRRLRYHFVIDTDGTVVSTHSRAEAAAWKRGLLRDTSTVSTHSRAEAAAILEFQKLEDFIVSTHSRAEAAAFSCCQF